MHDPLVTIIMPCLNSQATLAQAIESVMLQDFKDFELIVVDDGSSDCSVSLIEKYQMIDDRISLMINTGNHGVSYARNIGINAARGKYICFLDSDDYLLPTSLTLRLATAFKTGAKIVYGPYLKLLPNGRFVNKDVPKLINFKAMLQRNYIGNLTGMYDAQVLGKLLQQPLRHEDYLMWCQLLKLANHGYSTGAEPIAVYRVSHNSLSGNKFKAFVWHWDILRSGLGLNVFVSIYFQSYYLFSSLLERLLYVFDRREK